MKVKITDVNVEWVAKGKSKYGKASVSYTYNGEQRSQNIMSFANPNVFKLVQELKGQEVEVTLTKNAQNYTEWSAVEPLNSGNDSTPARTPTTRVGGSNYETPEERAKKQVYIIKQSSITAAISILAANQEPVTLESVKKVAQDLTDWVLGKDPNSSGFDDLQDDIPL
ncbi:MAG: hypothetical protein ACK5PF_02350 [bacterium]|jgi:hypothetical protein